MYMQPIHIPAGLLTMCVDIPKSLFRNLASQEVALSEKLPKTLRATHPQVEQETIRRYKDNAVINSLLFDRRQERTALEAFLTGIKLATERLLDDRLGVSMISNCSQVVHAAPDIFERIVKAVEDHAREPATGLTPDTTP